MRLSPIPGMSLSPHTVRLDFDPARDGFSFPNRFSWTDEDLATLGARVRPLSAASVALATTVGGVLGGRLLGGKGRGAVAGLAAGAALGWGGGADGLVRTLARRWKTFGLCGGMALAAIERWPRREGAVPTADLQQDPLRALLRRRQETTLRASLPRFAGWWLRARAERDPDGPFASALRRELDRVVETLRAGRPALVGLIGDAPDPFALHQVVVYGIERRGPLDATVYVYDPNAPGQPRTITTSASPKRGRTRVSTTLPTGTSEATGRVHISTRPHHLAHVFVIDVDGAGRRS